MEILGLILTVLLLVGLFIALRRIERWLHQHIFKVGWLATHNYQTTTILYYTFFLPGVVLHEVVYWLVAGILNVRAEHSLEWPDAQEIGELKLNFVQISNRAASWRKAIISISPLVAGILVTWLIAENILRITAAVAVMGSGELSAVADGFAQLTQAPNFWLWVYIVFTIANTMFPQIPKDLQGWRAMLIAAVAVAVALTLIGLGGEIFEALSPTINTLLDTLLTTLIFLIATDVLVVLVLGTIEYTIERVTGHSATFKGGKMITMTREEAQEERRKERERERRRAERQRRAEEALPANVYALAFPIPGSPDEATVTPLVEEQAPQEPRFAGSAVPDEEQPPPPEQEAAPARRDDLAARIRMPQPRPLNAQDDDEIEEDEQEELPVSMRRPSVPVQVDAEETNEEASDEQSLKPPTFSRRPPLSLTPEEQVADEEDGEMESEPEKPARPTAFGRSPLSLTSEPETTTDEDDDQQEAKPATPAASRFGVRPPQPAITDDDIDDEDESDEEPEEKTATPAASRFGVRPPQPAITKDEDEEEDDSDESHEELTSATSKGTARPATSRFSPRPFQPSKTRDSENDEEEDKPTASRPPGFSSRLTPSPTKPRQTRFDLLDEDGDGLDDDEDKPASPRGTLRFGIQPMSTRATGTISENDEDDEGKSTEAPRSRLSGFGSTLRSSTPAFDDADEDEDEDFYYEEEDDYYDEDDEEYLDYDDEE